MRLNQLIESDLAYYLEEGCGIFAYALSTLRPGGQIVIISNAYGEKWSRSIPFEVTHAAYRVDGQLYDVKGSRTIPEMAADFGLTDRYRQYGGGDYRTYEFDPQTFKKRFMGNSDSKPLYGSKADFAEGVELIRKNPAKYGLEVS